MVAVHYRAFSAAKLGLWLTLVASGGCAGRSQADGEDGAQGGTSNVSGSGGTSSMGELPACRCTREGAYDFQCPQGRGEEAHALIGSEGGIVELMGEQGRSSGVAFALRFPINVFESEAMVVVTELQLPPPADFVDFSPLYQVEATADIAGPVEMKVPWGNKAGSVGQELSIYFQPATEDAGWERVPDSYLNASFMQGTLTAPGLYFAGYPVSAESQCP